MKKFTIMSLRDEVVAISKWVVCPCLIFLSVQFCFTEQKRVAVLYFENIILPEKITSAELGLYNVDRQYDYLERALTDMLISDLADTKDIELVERSKVEKLLDEIHFGETGAIDENTVQKAGKALQSDYLIFGYIDKKKGKILLKTKNQNVSNRQIKTISLSFPGCRYKYSCVA